jgi:hypothetical protein
VEWVSAEKTGSLPTATAYSLNSLTLESDIQTPRRISRKWRPARAERPRLAAASRRNVCLPLHGSHATVYYIDDPLEISNA